MAFIQKEKIIKDKKQEKKDKLEKLEKTIQAKKILLSNAFKIPPPINQFTYIVNADDKENLFAFLKNYKPETRKEKMLRLKKENPKEGPKPCLIKFGMNHVVSLIEQKKAKLVVIAANVDPIETVIYLPTLCVKMGVPYIIVDKKEELGELANLKKVAAIALTDIRGQDSGVFANIEKKARSDYNEMYEARMQHWGGGVLLSKQQETVKNE